MMSSNCFEITESLTLEKVQSILGKVGSIRAGVVGDACLDVYWEADVTKSELSRETPHYSLPVTVERYSPGAAGNVAVNLKALGCKEVSILSVIGNDWRGEIVRRLFQDGHIDTSFLLASENWTTPAYCRPLRIGLQGTRQEDPRLDFQNFGSLPIPATNQLIKCLDEMAERCDVIAVTDQMNFGVVTEKVRERLSHWSRKGKVILADSRSRIGLFRDLIVKPNEVEAARWFQSETVGLTMKQWAELGERLSLEVNGPCCITLGSQGALWVEREKCVMVTARPAEEPLDPIGAGDCFAAALLCALGAGCEVPDAALFANLSASIVVKKIRTTGTASPQEIVSQIRHLRYGSQEEEG